MVQADWDICLVAGARPNFIKIAPILRAIKGADAASPVVRLRPHLVHTGQHYDRRMSDVFFRDLEIPQPEANFDVRSGTHAAQTAAIMLAFEHYCQRRRPDVVVVVGDVNSTLACSLVAAKMGIALAHVEAGLRSFDRSMPEEINRMVTDRLADLLFVSEESGLRNLAAEGVDAGKVHFVGNVMIDTLLHSLAKLDRRGGPTPAHSRYGLVTMHRPSNVDDEATLARLLGVLSALSSELPLLFPVHPRTASRLGELGLDDRFEWHKGLATLDGVEGLAAVPPLGYLDFLDLMRHAEVVFTDSGGIQEETTVLGIPCITLRDNTERPVTVALGTNSLVGTDENRIRSAFAEARAGGRRDARVPPLWDGKTAERIVEVLVADARRRRALCAQSGAADDTQAEGEEHSK